MRFLNDCVYEFAYKQLDRSTSVINVSKFAAEEGGPCPRSYVGDEGMETALSMPEISLSFALQVCKMRGPEKSGTTISIYLARLKEADHRSLILRG